MNWSLTRITKKVIYDTLYSNIILWECFQRSIFCPSFFTLLSLSNVCFTFIESYLCKINSYRLWLSFTLLTLFLLLNNEKFIYSIWERRAIPSSPTYCAKSSNAYIKRYGTSFSQKFEYMEGIIYDRASKRFKITYEQSEIFSILSKHQYVI